MILPLQYDEASGYCDNIQLMVGSRDHYDCWTELIPSADFVDYYRNADGSEFKWSAYLTGWDDLTPAQREVFFLRNNLTSNQSAYNDAKSRIGAEVMNKYYLDSGNEARIKKHMNHVTHDYNRPSSLLIQALIATAHTGIVENPCKIKFLDGLI